MKALVTGGAGFIGSHTVEELLRRAWEVRVLDDFSNGKPDNLPTHPRLAVLRGNIRSVDDVRQALQGVTHVVHLAAQVSVDRSIREPLESGATNIMGFATVLDGARREQVKRLVYASSAAVYGVPEQIPLSETSPTRPLSPYGLEKLMNEAYAELYGQLHGVSACGLRFFNVYGPRQDPRSPYAGVISRFAANARAGEPVTIFGDGRQTRDFVHVSDVARLTADALEKTFSGVCNIATGYSVSLLELVDAVRNALDRPVTVTHAPARAGDILHSQADVRRMTDLFGVQRPVMLVPGLRDLLAGGLEHTSQPA
jgi:UDP-glucose 4-epimerase